MLPSRFRSTTSLARLSLVPALVAGAALPGCGDDSCGPGGAPDVGLVAAGDAVTLTYGGLTAGLNNDCPGTGAPAGITGLTITGAQTDGTGFITLCIARQDLFADQPQPLALDAPGSTAARMVDVAGMAGGCSFAIDRTQPVTGTATASGLCGGGSDAAGFALVIDGALSLSRTCGPTVSSVPITLRGRVAVSPQP